MIELLQNPPKGNTFPRVISTATLTQSEYGKVSGLEEVVRYVTQPLRHYSDHMTRGILAQIGFSKILGLTIGGSAQIVESVPSSAKVTPVLPAVLQENNTPQLLKRTKNAEAVVASVSRYFAGYVDDGQNPPDLHKLDKGADRLVKVDLRLPTVALDSCLQISNFSGYTKEQVIRLGLLAGSAVVEAQPNWDVAKSAYEEFMAIKDPFQRLLHDPKDSRFEIVL